MYTLFPLGFFGVGSGTVNSALVCHLSFYKYLWHILEEGQSKGMKWFKKTKQNKTKNPTGLRFCKGSKISKGYVPTVGNIDQGLRILFPKVVIEWSLKLFPSEEKCFDDQMREFVKYKSTIHMQVITRSDFRRKCKQVSILDPLLRGHLTESP